MSGHKFPKRTDAEWMDIINTCRRSGYSDAEWCRLNGIPKSSLCNAARRLHQKSYQIPGSVRVMDDPINNLIAPVTQDVVKIDLSQDSVPATYDAVPATVEAASASSFFDNSHTIEIIVGDTTLRISNSANPDLLKLILGSIKGGLLC